MAFYSLRNDYARLYHAAGTSTPLLSVERASLAPGCGSNFDVLGLRAALGLLRRASFASGEGAPPEKRPAKSRWPLFS
jgi:hypothetical protein